jgi:Zn-dependent protease
MKTTLNGITVFIVAQVALFFNIIPEYDPDVDGRIILRWIVRKWHGLVGIGWRWLRIGTGGGHL